MVGVCYFYMDFCYQWVGGVKNGKIVVFCFVMYCLGNFMSGEDQNGVIWYFVNLFYKDCFVLVQVVYYIVVMYDFVLNVNWCVVNGECIFNNVDSVVYFGVKIVWVG